MASIRVLPDSLIDRIAAGEVIERPASVVKELVENSLDSRAGRIDVEISKAGSELIQVRDNGSGMDRDDALLCLDRHATSKITADTDLHQIETLGFRGEALPSIASVSRMTLRTRTRTSEVGCVIRVRGGKIESVREEALPEGTSVEVRDLFFNVPARKKFLKSPSTETGHINGTVQRAALGNLKVDMTLRHNGRDVFRAPPASDLNERIAQILGRDRGRNLIPLSYHSTNLNLMGVMARPDYQKSLRERPLLYVNGRPVRDNLLGMALRQALRSSFGVDRSPFVVLFLEISREDVDVNVHPAKAEVRFRDSRPIFSALREAISSSLSGVSAPGKLRLQRVPRQSSDRMATPVALPRGNSNFGKSSNFPIYERPDSATTERIAVAESTDGAIRILGQYRSSFIVAEDDEGLVLIDQHVAHERILFDEIAEKASKDSVPSQSLLSPVTVEASPEKAAVCEKHLDELQSLGFDIEPFGSSTLWVRAAPFDLNVSEISETLNEILETLEEGGEKEPVRRNAAATLACHAAVKINEVLPMEKMRYLVDKIMTSRKPAICPHGRPLILRFEHADIERGFLRPVSTREK